MQLDLFGATEESAIQEAQPPVLSAAGIWSPPETISFNAALHRGSLGDAINILNRLKVGAATNVLLASGFTLGKGGSRAELIAGVQVDVLAAVRLRLTGAELRAAREVVPAPVVEVEIAPVVPSVVLPALASESQFSSVDTVKVDRTIDVPTIGDGVYRHVLMSKPTVLYRSVSPEEWEQIQNSNLITGGLNTFNVFDPRREVFFGDALNSMLIGQGEDVTRRIEFQLQNGPIGLLHKNAVGALKKIEIEIAIRVNNLGYETVEDTPRFIFNIDNALKSLNKEKFDANNNIDKIKSDFKIEAKRMAAELRAADVRRGYSSVILKTKPILVKGGKIYSKRYGSSGMGDHDEYGVPSGAIKLSDVVEISYVMNKEINTTKTLSLSPKSEMGQEVNVDVVNLDLVKEQAVIVDAGAELTYNRRNRIKTAKGWGDIVHLNDALKVKETVKTNVWPKPDYKQLLADGMPPMVTHIVKQVYDSIAVKPMVGRKELDDVALRTYITALNRVEAGLLAWATDSDALQQWAAQNAKVAGAMLGRTTALGSLVSKGDRTLLAMIYPDGYKSYLDEIRIAGGNKMMGALQPGHPEIKRAMKAIDGGWPEKREAWEVQGYQVVGESAVSIEKYSGADKYFLSVNERFVKSFESQAEAQVVADGIRPFVLFGKRGFVDSFDSEEEAIASAKERSQKQRTQGVTEKGGRVDAVERVGISRRMEGEDISSERLMTEFGFKGVNFGNWMKTAGARAESQLHLNHAFDSFHDLADILGVPPKAMSLGGMLGLAFGAQGGGGTAAAHFVPGLDEINLTRTSGAGFLAHEFGHALDHYYARKAGLATATEPFLSAHANLSETKTVFQMVDGRQTAMKLPRFGDVRSEIVAAVKVIVNVMERRMETDAEVMAGQASSMTWAQDSLARTLKTMRRDFVGQEAAFDAIGERVLAGDVGDGKVALSRAFYVSPIVVEIRDLYKASSGRAYPVARVKDLQSSMDSMAYLTSKKSAEVAHVPQKVASDYAKNARSLDRDKGGKPYWATSLEMFARAFDAFVSDELEAKQARNDYLSRTGVADETVPAGTEREAINAAFRGLVSEFKIQETERGPVLFSKGADGAVSNVAGSVRSMPIDQIAAEIERLRGQWPSMPKVNVVAGVADLPFEAPGNADGAYSGGQVYVIAGNVADLKQLQKVMAHECVLHHGLEDMLGEYGFSKLHRGIQKLKNNGDPEVVALAENIRGRYGVLPPEMETKEIVARAGEQCLDSKGNVKVAFGFMKGVFAGIASWLRDHGIGVPFSNLELQGIMHNAGEWMKQGAGQEQGQRPAQSADGLDGVVVGKCLNSLAEQGDHSLESVGEIAFEGNHLGRVLDIVDGIALQKTGRTEVVRHDVTRLSDMVAIGDLVDIRYKEGIGNVGELAAEVGHGR